MFQFMGRHSIIKKQTLAERAVWDNYGFNNLQLESLIISLFPLSRITTIPLVAKDVTLDNQQSQCLVSAEALSGHNDL